MSDPRLQNAMQLRRAGRLADAARIYGEILASEPLNFEALHALGIISYQSGKLDDAENLIGRARIVLVSWKGGAEVFKPWTWVLRFDPGRTLKSVG